ncbi:IS110 family transposase [Anaerobacillus alkaliphilus]|uniref:IS110 family transposase n=1 Tax=Anaerobacillus alkaliphilus TaxID=1548597 RepID=A0A4Q0VVQ5_9BACI|nr:IS110 family transposase [Anaerobacillus alkaliphilus]RXJ02190.1 IS110 family transposase [Anaerobacillus alkaliphilus]RXJ02200.1 IS110 family transposase [Anaerobacillus alkaliphilus]RXJ02209.1 IS110 family transposase [Anaerobacillus alkaliphilus]RXJ02214.1 IS110 family transposase [Anaerobacillus alkaliphilus]RXJ02231.1 IS110 family transposase [Anaerobacillus alkaliphilus]
MVYTLLNHIQGKKGSRWAKFLQTAGLENILIVAVDAAKYTHKAMICTFYGEILKKPFEFDASLTGHNQLISQIEKVSQETGKQSIVIGIETTGHYYEDLVRHWQGNSYYVRIINAATTSEERKALLNRSKTDNLDLLAITQSVINGRGTSSELPSGSVHELQKLTRARRTIVQEKTALQNEIRVHIDHIFREFQGMSIWRDGKRVHVQPFEKLFGKAGRYLMRHFIHPSDIINLGVDGLREISIKENLKIRDSSIQLLLEFASNSISRPKEELEIDHFLLVHKLDRLELVNQQIDEMEQKIASLFIETEGAVLLTVPGVGLVTGAELYGEMGDISDFDHAGQLIKMAGTNPIVVQSGGRNPTYHCISREGRRTFRNSVYQIGKSLAMHNPKMKKQYQEMRDRGKYARQAYIALGNRMIRLAFAMIRKQTMYQSEEADYTLLAELTKKLKAQHVKRFYTRYFAV